jgi:type IV pilus assembly protein PilY1
MQRLISSPKRAPLVVALASASATFLWGWSSPAMAAAAAPTVSIAQVPMTITLPAHPQILLAVGNSQSMDGDLSGAIYTGSGSTVHTLLATSSSPVNFTVPAGFTPPVTPGTGGVAPYTVSSGGLLLDNSASRLNVAKAGITSILNAYIASADFALMDYSTSGMGEYVTWVYQMSQPGGFTFTSIAPTNSEYVLNPCYGIDTTGPLPVEVDCKGLKQYYAGQNITAKQWMVVSASSDDAAINDVLYAGGGIDPVCVVYSGPSPPTPFPPYYSLGSYNYGGVYESYYAETSGCAPVTGPTNAGYVPYSAEVMYEERGFGFYTFGEAAGSAATLVPMTSSGATPSAASVATAIAQFTPYLLPETNSTGTNEMKAAATQSPMAGVIASAQTLFAGNPPTTNGCAAQRYVVLMTDGLPTMDLAGLSWPPLGSTAATGYGVTATFNTTNGSLITTNDQALTDVINKLKALNSGANPVKTYIIGLGAGIDPTTVAGQTLTAMAVAGGTNVYFPATTPQAVTDDLQIIITKILDQSQSTASAAVNSTGLNANSVVYQSQFVTSDTYQDWTGNLYAFSINSTTGVVDTSAADAYWSAQTQLDASTSRLIATWDPVQGTAVPFEWTAGTPLNGIGPTTVLGQDLTTFTPDPSGQDVLQYLRGSTLQEVRNGGKFRNRAHLLGDIVDSNPAYIGPSNEGIQATSYVTYAASTATRPPILYIGANDGMLHAFDITTGNERFAYIPKGAYANLVGLASPYYNAQHRFFVNGSPQAGDVQFTDLTWHSLLVGTEAAGGNSVYALDVTNPAALTSESALASAVLWDFTDTDMGLGYSTPVIASTTSGWQVFVGNGYNSTNQKPFLYALNPQTGAINAKVDLCAAVATACSLTASNGLSSATVVNTGGQVAGYANIVYAGDLQGNLWRVDVSNSSPTLWTVTVVFQARDALGNKQPITTKPVITLNPRYPQILGTMVLFGTGQFLGMPDLTNENTQSIYGVYDPPAGYTTALTRTNLLQQTLATATIGTVQVRTITGTTPTVPTNKGWFMDLSLLSGERVINDPRLESGGELVLTTYQPIPPATGSCNAGGSSYLMVINYATGGAFSTPQFDVNGDGKINTSDTVTMTVSGVTTTVSPVGMSLGNVYASAPTIRSGAFTTGSGIALITESTPGVAGAGGTGISTTPIIQPVILKGAPKNRTAWWEIRQ